MPYNYYITPEEYEEAEKNGITYDHVNTRVRGLGWDKERAITQPVKKYKRKRKNLQKWAKVATKNGIPYTTFHSRIEKGMDHKEAATKPIKCKKEVVRRNESKKNEKYREKVQA